MKRIMPKLLGVLAVCSALNLQPSTALAQGTAFTYQGRLAVGGNAETNGIYDFTFALFAINTGGSAVAGPVTNAAVGVTNGLFSTMVDLGADFPGADRWLEIGARTNGPGAFTMLSPRQKLTSTPYSIQSANAVSAVSVSGSVSALQLVGHLSPTQHLA